MFLSLYITSLSEMNRWNVLRFYLSFKTKTNTSLFEFFCSLSRRFFVFFCYGMLMVDDIVVDLRFWKKRNN